MRTGPYTSVDLYYCNGQTFDEESAPHLAAMLEEVRLGKHKVILLENVQGLLRKRDRDGNCIDFVQAQLKEASAGRYFMHVNPNVSPHLFGEPVHTANVFIRMIRTDQCLVSS